MKVIFFEDVPGVGKTGEIKDVASGYARNMLIPKKLAGPASDAAIELLQAQLKKVARTVQQTEEELKALAGELEGKEIIIKAKAGAKSRLYGSVTNADIAAEMKKSLKLIIDKKKIDLAKPINQLGSYQVPVRLNAELIPNIKVTVTEGETA